jgi:hypothetical protein
MTIATYSDLKTAINDWLGRSDLTSKADDFIDLAEAFFNLKLQVLNMQKAGTITTTANTATVSLPADYLSMIMLSLTSDPSPIDKVSLKFINEKYRMAQVGRPVVYCDYPDAKIQLGPTPDSVYTLNILYYYGVTPLSDSNTTNWLLTSLPNLYLAACLYNAAGYIKDYEAQDRFAAEVNLYLEQLRAKDRSNRLQEEKINTQVMYGVV